MELAFIDWTLIIAFFVISLAIGLYSSKRAGQSVKEFFLSGGNMPWWLLGVSMVATTFSADTPNLVTDIVRQNGVSGNWVWWAFLLTGMLTVFIYARLWRKSGVMTDLEFYEIRYGGKPAAFLRGFRAIYLGILFNVITMATVTLAAIKIGGVLLGLEPWETVIYGSIVTVIYSSLGGLRGVLLTDFLQFFIAMLGSIWAAKVSLNHPMVGGLANLLSHENVAGKLALVPDFSDASAWIPLLLIPLAVQWWATWYPGAEPGGGGYIAQRMLSARNEKHAVGATLLFNAAHYALRPWPWILVALCSLVVFPTLESIQTAFPHMDASVIGHDLGYSAMLSFLPAGVLGLVIASLIAAYMSTISTQLNWGSSYVVHDFYHRFVDKNASEKRLVLIGRLSTVTLMVLSGLLALTLQNALQAFDILLQIGAGTGLIFILRWFWSRINAYSEISAMIISFAVALYFAYLHDYFGFAPMASHMKLITGVGITTVAWILTTYLTPREKEKTLKTFYDRANPGGPGWKSIAGDKALINWQVPMGIAAMIVGCITVYSALFSTGYWIYGKVLPAAILTLISIVGVLVLLRLWKWLN
jgi:Na+/proline symporter